MFTPATPAIRRSQTGSDPPRRGPLTLTAVGTPPGASPRSSRVPKSVSASKRRVADEMKEERGSVVLPVSFSSPVAPASEHHREAAEAAGVEARLQALALAAVDPLRQQLAEQGALMTKMLNTLNAQTAAQTQVAEAAEAQARAHLERETLLAQDRVRVQALVQQMGSVPAPSPSLSLAPHVKPDAHGPPSEEVSGLRNIHERTEAVGLGVRLVPDAAGGLRPRGGEDRLAARIESIRRLLGTDVPPEEVEKTIETLRAALEVPPSSSSVASSALHVRAVAGRQRLESPVGGPLSSMLHGLIRREVIDEEEAVGNEVAHILREKVRSTKKAYPTFKCFGNWMEEMSRRKLLSFALVDAGEEGERSFWTFDWHWKCVVFLFSEFNWATAATYDRLVMEAWDDIDSVALSRSTALSRGDYERACEPYALQRATQHEKRRRRAGAKSATGVANKAELYCSFCKRWCNHEVEYCDRKAAKEARVAAQAKLSSGRSDKGSTPPTKKQ
jgi:hypothetical protein